MVSVDTGGLDMRFRVRLSALLGGMILFAVTDLWLDQPLELLSFHVAVEVGFVALAVVSVIYLWAGWMRARRAVAEVEASHAASEVAKELWRRRADGFLKGLSREIDRQFESWSLTRGEREVALLLLRGLEYAECAAVLGRSEWAVRHDAESVYEKSGISGRARLSAFFLGDLLVPPKSGGGKQEDESSLH